MISLVKDLGIGILTLFWSLLQNTPEKYLIFPEAKASPLHPKNPYPIVSREQFAQEMGKCCRIVFKGRNL
ncbi:hypothetical protein ACQP3J_33285, partial [Escherichia coli]